MTHAEQSAAVTTRVLPLLQVHHAQVSAFVRAASDDAAQATHELAGFQRHEGARSRRSRVRSHQRRVRSHQRRFRRHQRRVGSRHLQKVQ